MWYLLNRASVRKDADVRKLAVYPHTPYPDVRKLAVGRVVCGYGIYVDRAYVGRKCESCLNTVFFGLWKVTGCFIPFNTKRRRKI